MQIQVRCGCGEGGCPEWAIVELQGVVESQHSAGGRLQSLEIGRLCCSSQSQVLMIGRYVQNTYTFTVGYHELSGMKVALKKPLLVLRKRNADSDGSSRTELEVIGIIRQKILFKSRPRALISKPQVKEKKNRG